MYVLGNLLNKLNKTELEDFSTFLEKETRPKELRNINPALLELSTRVISDLSGNVQKKIEKFKPKREITEEEKDLIKLKYNMKRLETNLFKDVQGFNKLKSTIGVKNGNKSPKKRSKASKKADSDQKSSSPLKSFATMVESSKKNNRYGPNTKDDDTELDVSDSSVQKSLSF
jgi:hypothetical protein